MQRDTQVMLEELDCQQVGPGLIHSSPKRSLIRYNPKDNRHQNPDNHRPDQQRKQWRQRLKGPEQQVKYRGGKTVQNGHWQVSLVMLLFNVSQATKLLLRLFRILGPLKVVNSSFKNMNNEFLSRRVAGLLRSVA